MVEAIPHALGLNPILISPKTLDIGPKINAILREITTENPAKNMKVMKIIIPKKGPNKPDLDMPPIP